MSPLNSDCIPILIKGTNRGERVVLYAPSGNWDLFAKITDAWQKVQKLDTNNNDGETIWKKKIYCNFNTWPTATNKAKNTTVHTNLCTWSSNTNQPSAPQQCGTRLISNAGHDVVLACRIGTSLPVKGRSGPGVRMLLIHGFWGHTTCGYQWRCWQWILLEQKRKFGLHVLQKKLLKINSTTNSIKS